MHNSGASVKPDPNRNLVSSFGNFQFPTTDPSYSNPGFPSAPFGFGGHQVSQTPSNLAPAQLAQPPTQYIQSVANLPNLQTSNPGFATNILQ
jgi:hypothetical protein